MATPNQADYDAIAAQLTSEMAEIVGAERDTKAFDPGTKKEPKKPRPWVPLLGPTQTEVFNDQSDVVGVCSEKFTGKCAHPSTLVYTPTGPRRLRSFQPLNAEFGFTPISQPVLAFDGQQVVEDTAVAFYRETRRDALRFTFSNGKEFICSKWHPIWTCYREEGKTRFGYLKAEEIRTRQASGEAIYTPLMECPAWSTKYVEVAIQAKRMKCSKCGKPVVARGLCGNHYAYEKSHGTRDDHPKRITQKIRLTEPFSYALGALCGDGSCNAIDGTTRSILFTNIDSECVSAVRSGLAEVGADLTGPSRKYCYGLIKASAVRRVLVALKLDCLSYNKCIPDEIMESPRSVLVAFLQGLFDTDGTVDKHGFVSMTTVSNQLADDVMDALQAIGIVAAKRWKKSASGRPTWNVIMCGQQAHRFKQRVGFRITRKQNRIKEPVPNRLFPDGFRGGGYGFPKFISDALAEERTNFFEANPQTNAWHNANRGTMSLRSTPGRQKLNRALAILGCEDAIKPYLVSDHWVHVAGCVGVDSELVDLSVEKTHSFLGSGLINHNSIVCLEAIVAHCYLEFDALYVIIGNAHRALAEGVCNDLVTFTLPRWRDGNRAPPYLRQGGVLVPNPRAGELIDNGIGLEFTPWKSDPNNKDLFLKIRNQYGGWSRIRVIAIPYAEMVQSRVTNLNASGLYLEEATRCDGPDYFKWPALQLYRRRGIKGAQQFRFSCNPDDPCRTDDDYNDPKKWVYRWMYKDCVVGKSDPGREWPKDPEKPGIRRDPQVAFYTLPYRENEHNVSSKNREIVERTLRADPAASDRLLKGKWATVAKGDGLFKASFNEARHIKGDAEKRQGLCPVPGHPIVISLDWGPQSMGIVFKQIIETADGPFDIAFDSLSFYQEMHRTRELARALLEKMNWWNGWLRRERDWDPETNVADASGQSPPMPSWCFWFIAGDDATTNFNPESGNVHSADLKKHIEELLEEDAQRYAGIEVPIIRGCPRPKDSVSKRHEIVTDNLMTDMAVISALCEDIRGMFLHLLKDKDNPSHPQKNNRWIHIYDAYSYANYYRRFCLPGGFYNYEAGSAVSVA